MRRPDALSILLLLRKNEVEAARQQAAQALDRQRAAEQSSTAIADAMAQETAAAGPQAYAAWIATARHSSLVQTAAVQSAEAGVALTQQVLSAARLAEQVALDARQEQRRHERRRRLSREQRILDDL